MITYILEEKIKRSKEILKLASEMSKYYYHKPLIITYSGGKDSDVMLQLARVGCIGCPLAGNQIKELEMYPKYKLNYIRAFDRMLKRRKENGKDDTTGKEGLHKWTDGEVVFKWWIGDDSIDGQMGINDFIN